MPLIPVAIEGGALAAEGVEAAAGAYEAYRIARAAQAAARLARAARAAQALKEGAQTDVCSTCDPPDDPCKHLKRGNGKGKYRGGSHGEMTKPAGDGLDSHHMPSAQSIKGTMARDDGAAIQMLPQDHRMTLSYGGSADAQAYRSAQADLIKNGDYSKAFDNDANNVRDIAREAGDPHRYDEALKEAKAYADCMDQHMSGK